MAPARRGPRAEADAKVTAPRRRDPSRRRADPAAGPRAREARAEADARATAPAALIRASRMSRGGRGARARRRRARVRMRRPLAETRGTVPPVSGPNSLRHATSLLFASASDNVGGVRGWRA